MSKLIKSLLLAMLTIMLGCVLVNAHEYVVLTQNNPNTTVSSGESVTIYGTSDANQITVESGADVELVNFQGSNTVSIESDSAGFTVFRSGATVTFQGSDGTRLSIPATQTAQIIDFTDRPSLTLSIYDGEAMLDDQVVTTTAASIDDSSEVIRVWYKDSDGDGYSDGESQRAYTRPGGEYYLSTELTATDGDCNDNNYRVHPGAEDICDNFIDDDCDGKIDEDCTLSAWYKDSDGDGFSDGESQRAYTRPGDEYYLSTELTATDGDCNDNNYRVHPGAEDICDNGTDDDCDGKIDEDCTSGSGECGAYTAPGVWKEFDCYNLAAIGKTTGDDPFTPSWRLIGGYWQWGRKGPDESKWYDTNTSNFAHGPRDSDETDANDNEIDGWDDSYADNDAWSDDEKTSNDPCPSGYRVPTEAQWAGVIENNTQSTVGSWLSDSTNYSSGLFFGDDLMLPAAGRRSYDSGSLIYRGDYGSYWSSTKILGTSSSAWRLYFTSSYVGTSSTHRRSGYSVRCIAE